MINNLSGSQLGQYEIHEEIGHGGMAVVFRATQRNNRRTVERPVAVKVLHPHFRHQEDNDFFERFYKEVKLVAGLQHPHILPVHDFGEQDNIPYIVMAYMPGGTLDDEIRQGSGMAIDRVARLIEKIADALDYAHKNNIIHRDVKPSNVLLDEDGNPYLADFGIAKLTGSNTQFTGSKLIGTPAYMAPEMGSKVPITLGVDVYALGVSLYRMLTTQLPFIADSITGMLMAHATEPIPDVRKLRPDLPDAVQAVIARAMAKNPLDRFASAGEMAAALREAVHQAPKPDKRHKQLFPMWLGTVFAALVIAGGTWLLLKEQAEIPPQATLPGLSGTEAIVLAEATETEPPTVASTSIAPDSAALTDPDAPIRVLWDLTHGPRSGQSGVYTPTDLYSDLSALLGSYNISVIESETQVVSDHLLAEYDVLVLAATSAEQTPFSSLEAQAIRVYVEAGHGLIILSEQSGFPDNLSPITEVFGVTLDSSVSNLAPVDFLSDHPITEGVAEVKLVETGTFRGVEVIGMAGSTPVIGATRQGLGRVVIIADSNLWDNRWLNQADNEQFAINVFQWVAGR